MLFQVVLNPNNLDMLLLLTVDTNTGLQVKQCDNRPLEF
jgi:hypothetical protein